MKTIGISQIPNQSLSVQIDSLRYDIRLKETNGVMSIDLARDNINIVIGARLVAGQPIIPYRYKEDGNFFLSTLGDDLPDYTKFGVSQFLYYFTATELLTIRA